MIDIQEQSNELYKTAVSRIDSDFKEGKNLSFHHYAVKFGLDAHRLQSEWVKHNHAKKMQGVADGMEITRTA